MNKYEYRDSLVGKNRADKMLAAQNLTGLGYHETIEDLFKRGHKQTKIVDMINLEAGKVIATRGSINASLRNLGYIGLGAPKNHRVKNALVPRQKKMKAIPTGKIRPCLKCDKDFPQTNVNHARCPSCTSQT